MSDVLLRRLFPADEHHVQGLHAVVEQLMAERGRILDLGCGTNTELPSEKGIDPLKKTHGDSMSSITMIATTRSKLALYQMPDREVGKPTSSFTRRCAGRNIHE